MRTRSSPTLIQALVPVAAAALSASVACGCCFGGDTSTPTAAPATTAAAAPAPAPGLRPVFAQSEIETTDEPRARVVVVGSRVSLYGPVGTTAVIDGRTLTVPASGPAEETLEPSGYIAGLGVEVRPGSGSTLPDLRAHEPVTRPVTISRPGMAPSSGTLTVTNRDLLTMFAAHFAAAQTGPVVVPEGSGLAVLRLHVTADVTTMTGVVGFILSPGDVGAVAIVRTVTREGPCGTYVRSDGVESSIHWYADDAEVSIRERATGRAIAERRFSARQPRCAGTIQTSPRTYADEAAVDAFIAANLPAPPPVAAGEDDGASSSAGTQIDPRLTMAAITGRLATIGATLDAQPVSDAYGFPMEVGVVFDAESRAFQLMLARLNDGMVGGEPHVFVIGDQSFTNVSSDGPMPAVRALATELGAPATQGEFAQAIARANLSATGPTPGIFVVDNVAQQWIGVRVAQGFTIERYDLTVFAAFGRGGRTVVMIAPLGAPAGAEAAASTASAARIMATLAR